MCLCVYVHVWGCVCLYLAVAVSMFVCGCLYVAVAVYMHVLVFVLID